MKIIKPYFEFIEENDPLKKIELCGRVCYKSESKITDDSTEKFVKNLISRGHESVLEHAVFIVECDGSDADLYNRICTAITQYNGGRVLLKSTQRERNIISGNVRAWRDFMRCCADYLAYPKFLTLFTGVLFDDVNPVKNRYTTARFVDKSELHLEEKDAHYSETVRFVVDRGISHEIVRHRTASFSQESTRYCNYSGSITFIEPPFFDDLCLQLWENEMQNIENLYNLLMSKGAKPQEARAVLPNSTKTELIMTATCDVWEHFLKLRTAAGAHPQMREIAVPLKDEFKARGII